MAEASHKEIEWNKSWLLMWMNEMDTKNQNESKSIKMNKNESKSIKMNQN